MLSGCAWRDLGHTFGSWMKLCPDLVFGGSSPVVACLRHSMIVCVTEVIRCDQNIRIVTAMGVNDLHNGCTPLHMASG
jgi:hypothetical protein